jgi:hypothetical protein
MSRHQRITVRVIEGGTSTDVATLDHLTSYGRFPTPAAARKVVRLMEVPSKASHRMPSA